MSRERLHHLTCDQGRWELRLTLEAGPKFVGDKVRVKLGKLDEETAILVRDKIIRAFEKAGMKVGMRKQRRRAPF